MSSSVRRRSRDPAAAVEFGVNMGVDVVDFAMDKDGETLRTRKPRRISTLTSLVAITIILAAVLVTWRYWAVFNWTPSLFNVHGDENHHDSSASDRFRLRPTDHVFREPSTFTYSWRISTGLRRPDGVLKRVYLVNDEFPGPNLELRSGDRVKIHVQNALDNDEGVTLHWHGLSMRDANDMDGAAGITQAPIKSGQNFTYDFMVDAEQHGTFWWHAHDGVQRADGLYGGLVVHEPVSVTHSEHFGDEYLLLVGDWYHRSAVEALEWYSHPGAFGLETLPDSLLVNGMGNYNCDDAVPARPVDCIRAESPPNIMGLDAMTKKVVRVVNVGAYTGFELSLSGAHLTPLDVDAGHPVPRVPSKSVGYLYPGERMSLEIEASRKSADAVSAELRVRMDEAPFKYENPALKTEHAFQISWNQSSMNTMISTDHPVEHFDIQAVTSSSEQHFHPSADHTIVLYSLTQKMARLDNTPLGFINHTTWAPQSPPLLELDREKWDEHQLVPHIEYNETTPLWVDIVLNNLDEDSHPFHLHGHEFWVLSKYSSEYNWGSYNPFEDDQAPGGDYDVAHPVKKDTVYVPRRGYAVLRFKADNPGLWMFHCHVLWHQASGMSMAFDVR